MDILAARKKAAEQAKARQQQNPVEAQEPPRPAVVNEPPAGQEVSADTPGPAPELERSNPLTPDAETEAPPGPTYAAAETHVAEGTAEAVSQELELLSFRLGAEEYAIMVEDVREVLKVFQLTRVPNAPEYVQGVMSLRGTVLPVIDLGMRLGMAPASRDEKARIIVVSTEDGDTGLWVDRVTGVFRIRPDEEKPVPEHIEKGAEYLRGIARKNEKLYILLDLEKAVGI